MESVRSQTETGRQCRQTDRQTNRADRLTDRQTVQTDKLTDGGKDVLCT